MARNKLTDLNNHLFAQLERLNDESLSEEQMQIEINRAKAISGISSQLINISKVTIDAMKLIANGDYTVNELPDMIGMEKPKNK